MEACEIEPGRSWRRPPAPHHGGGLVGQRGCDERRPRRNRQAADPRTCGPRYPRAGTVHAGLRRRPAATASAAAKADGFETILHQGAEGAGQRASPACSWWPDDAHAPSHVKISATRLCGLHCSCAVCMVQSIARRMDAMPLVLSLREGSDFYVDDEQIVVGHVYALTRFEITVTSTTKRHIDHRGGVDRGLAGRVRLGW